MRFRLQAINWAAPRGASFNAICDGVERAIRANPAKAQSQGWPTTRHDIEDWVDEYQAELCVRNGWTNYIYSDAYTSVPKVSAPERLALLANLKSAADTARELVAGAKTLNEYLDSGEPPVSHELADKRALTCVECPKNEAGDFTKWFTIPAAEYIRRQIEKASKRDLVTHYDSGLNLCTACHCPLKLKVHIPVNWITQRLTERQKAGLREGKNCWILSEAKL